MNTRRIAFVDYQLDNFHANVFLAALRQELQPRGYVVSGCHALDEAEGRAWSTKNQVPYFADPAELNKNTDYFMVLAPSNPELHLQLCERVFPFAKPTYVDKTFAPSLAEARQIFALADKYRTPIQTTSALRFTSVQEYVRQVGANSVKHMVTWGAGRSFGEYAIHPIELAVSCLGAGVESVMRRGDDECAQLLLNFNGGRSAVVNVYCNADTPFAAAVTTDKATKYVPVVPEALFIDAMAGVLDFFEKGQPTIDRAETLVIRRILDVVETAEVRQRFVKLDS